jgi:hypothetical protein
VQVNEQKWNKLEKVTAGFFRLAAQDSQEIASHYQSTALMQISSGNIGKTGTAESNS